MLKVVFFDLGNTLIVPGGGFVPGAKETVSSLKDRGLRLGLISNTGLPPTGLTLERLRPHLPADFDLGSFEDRLIVLSGDPAVAVEKPDAAIFQMSIERARETTAAEPSECLFCTETLHHTLAAQNVGMRSARVLTPPSSSDIGSLVNELERAQLLNP